MRLSPEQMQKLVDHLQGTCMSLEQGLYECFELECSSEVENELEMCDYLDNSLFLCVACGWWCECGDYAENQSNPSGDICSDCEPEEEE
jgi:hypothetical protein